MFSLFNIVIIQLGCNNCLNDDDTTIMNIMQHLFEEICKINPSMQVCEAQSYFTLSFVLLGFVETHVFLTCLLVVWSFILLAHSNHISNHLIESFQKNVSPISVPLFVQKLLTKNCQGYYPVVVLYTYVDGIVYGTYRTTVLSTYVDYSYPPTPDSYSKASY